MAEGQLKTNRDLYLFIRGLREVTAYGGVRDGDGRIKVRPDVRDDPVLEIEDVSWDGFADFLWAGAHYE